jgi:hypothetical protein
MATGAAFRVYIGVERRSHVSREANKSRMEHRPRTRLGKSSKSFALRLEELDAKLN